MRRFNVTPSQLGYMYSDCQRCLVRDVLWSVKRPGGPPDAFSAADKAMKAYFAAGERVKRHEIGVGPPFVVEVQSLWTESSPLAFEDLDVELVVRGKLDALVVDDAGRRIVLDYKTKVSDKPIDATYAPQLAAYAFGLENPVKGVAPTAVDGLALLIYNATSFAFKPDVGTSGLFGKTTWIDVERDDAAFFGLLRHVAELIAGAEPRPSRGCPWCVYYGAVPYERVPARGAA
jgi:hypothetical protein